MKLLSGKMALIIGAARRRRLPISILRARDSAVGHGEVCVAIEKDATKQARIEAGVAAEHFLGETEASG